MPTFLIVLIVLAALGLLTFVGAGGAAFILGVEGIMKFFG